MLHMIRTPPPEDDGQNNAAYFDSLHNIESDWVVFHARQVGMKMYILLPC